MRKYSLPVGAVIVWLSIALFVALRPDPETKPAREIKPDSPTLRYDFSNDEERYYQFSYSSFSSVLTDGISQPNNTTDIALSLAGGWCFTGAGRLGPTSWKFDSRILGLAAQRNDIDPLLVSILQEPFSFEIDSRGYMENFTFSSGVPDKYQPVLITLAKHFQFLLPGTARTHWKTIEEDGTGIFQARYSLAVPQNGAADIRLLKEKHGDVQLDFSEDDMTVLGTYRFESSRHQATLDEELGWLARIDTQEIISSPELAALLSRQVNSFSAALQPDSDICRSPLSAQSTEQKQAPPTPQPSVARQAPDAAALLQSLVAIWNSRDAGEIRKAEAELKGILEAHPQLSATLIAYLDQYQDSLPPDFIHSVFWVLARVGSVTIQENFARSMVDPRLGVATRIKLVLYSHDFSAPTPVIVDSLLRLYQRPRGAVSDHEDSLSNMALLAFGSLGAKEDVTGETQAYVADVLWRLLGQDAAVEARITQLSAAGNFQNAGLADVILPLTDSEHPLLRASAYEALMAAPETQHRAVEGLRREQNTGVIESALARLTTREISPEVNASVIQLGRETRDDATLSGVVRVLGEHLETYADNREILLEIYASNPGAQVKRQIFRYIRPPF